MRPVQSVYAPSDRQEVLALIPDDVESLLDVGCAGGGFGGAVRSRFGPRIRLLGIDPVESEVHKVRAAGHYDDVAVGYFPDDLRLDRALSCIAFNDVLEHIYDPWAAVRAARSFLAPQGCVVASIPNIRYLPHLWRLAAHSDWTYTDEGLLDRTHIRFFTGATIRSMFEQEGFHVEVLRGERSFLDRTRLGRLRHHRALSGDWQFLQILVRARVS